MEPLEWAAEIDSVPPVVITVVRAIHVSTVFLGIEYPSMWKAGMLFETTITGGKLSGMHIEYASYAEAENGHWLLVALAGDLPCWRVVVLRLWRWVNAWIPIRLWATK